jgi:hypothetical protein
MKNRKNKVALFLVFLSVLLPFTGFTLPDIPPSPEFKSNSENWKIKIRQHGLWGKKPADIDFGPLKTISTEVNGLNSFSETDRELYWKNNHSSARRESSMRLVLNGSDTAMVHMLTIQEEFIKEKKLVGTLVNANSEGNEYYHVSSWVDNMVLQFQNDSIVWNYRKIEAESLFGILEKIQDTSVRVFLYRTNNLEDKKMKEIMFSQPAIGFVFEFHGKQVAACQTLLKQMIWVSHSLDPDLRKVILAMAAAVIATVKSGNAKGY